MAQRRLQNIRLEVSQTRGIQWRFPHLRSWMDWAVHVRYNPIFLNCFTHSTFPFDSLIYSILSNRRLYVDSRLTHMLELKLNEPFFERGDFPPVIQNGSETIVLQNPWINGTRAAPFDQRGYPCFNLFLSFSSIIDPTLQHSTWS